MLRTYRWALSPFNAVLTIQGIQTPALRVDRHFANAEKIAAWLANRPEIVSVNHPSVPRRSPIRSAFDGAWGDHQVLVRRTSHPLKSSLSLCAR